MENGIVMGDSFMDSYKKRNIKKYFDEKTEDFDESNEE